jgi:hypothetical protein
MSCLFVDVSPWTQATLPREKPGNRQPRKPGTQQPTDTYLRTTIHPTINYDQG